jgi:hypothetical protein
VALSFLGGFLAAFFVGMISIAQCLERMHNGELFSLKCVSYDRRRKDRRGQVIEIKQGKLVWGDGGSDRVAAQGERPLTELEKKLVNAKFDKIVKKPAHQVNYTRNVRVYIDGHSSELIKKVHPALIIEFNGQTTYA